MSPMVRSSICFFTACLVSGALPTKAIAFEGSWQLGINGGISRLDPDTNGSDFTLDDRQSEAFGVYFGLDITPIISAELAYTDLGEATLSQNETITYQAVSLGATAYVLGESEADRRSDGLSAFVRLGLSAINNDADIQLSEDNNVSVWVGAGVQYPFSDHWGVRAELTSYDGDAQALLAGLYWRAGGNVGGSRSVANPPTAQPPQIPDPVQRPATATQDAAPQARVPQVPAPQVPAPQVPAPQAPIPIPPEQPRATTSAASCPPEAAGSFSDTASCAVLNSPIEGLTFNAASAAFNPSSAGSLDQVVTALKQNPGTVIEIRAHVQSMGNAQTEAQLSAQRAKSVARFLVQNGVPVAQLRAKAFGATQPLEDGVTAEARRLNNRVELRSL